MAVPLDWSVRISEMEVCAAQCSLCGAVRSTAVYASDRLTMPDGYERCMQALLVSRQSELQQQLEATAALEACVETEHRQRVRLLAAINRVGSRAQLTNMCIALTRCPCNLMQR